MKCIRCKKSLPSGLFCQPCKGILLPYFENTQDWHLAFEMESIHRSMAKYMRFKGDIAEF
ncbi:MAG: hypothetical protein IPM71_07780 [Bacteroidota bacterium]|nr:MAG: hypothetical protein IPM71_07780 [Bacteroidota bacterium]